MALGALVQPGRAADAPAAEPSALLTQAERLGAKDHPRFVELLRRLHGDASRLSPADQWRLRFLDAWEIMFEGDYTRSETLFHDVIDHSGNVNLAAKASAQLLSNLATNRRYADAFALANRLTTSLPDITDAHTRFTVLNNLSQMLSLAGQTDLAIRYAQMAQDSTPAGETQCYPLYFQAAALYNGKKLKSDSPLLQRAIDTCVAARQPVITNAMWLILVSLYLDNNQPDKAMALLQRTDASVRANHYYPQMLSWLVQQAQTLEKLGKDSDAKKAALAALAMSHPDDISEWLKAAYEVLYKVEKKQGRSALALSYYEQYAIQDKGYLDDISARTLAYEMARQHMLVQKLETESLSKQNNILRLQEALATKAVEASRLYIALLLAALFLITYWLLRLKRSQLRFKQLSSLDGLTGIFNHQHFISECDRALRMLEKKLGSACLVFIDLDYFKLVNDTHGHAMGDTVLKRTVAICRQHLRPTDLFGRLGGEEFGILLMDCSRDQGMAIADRIRLAIEAAPVDVDGLVVSFSASLGLASTDTSGYALQRLCRQADVALYKAKRTGRNRVITDAEGGHLADPRGAM
jgi:diguanylate cyclase (GGDEF)-like protein